VWRVRGREVMSMDNELMLGYDREADVLYLSFGEPQRGMEYTEVGNDIVLRVHPQTRRIVGVTIIDFAEHFSTPAVPAKLPVVGEFVLTEG